jgi:hypothetical protein
MKEGDGGPDAKVVDDGKNTIDGVDGNVEVNANKDSFSGKTSPAINGRKLHEVKSVSHENAEVN